MSVCKHEEARRQLKKRSNAAINHLWKERRETGRRTLSSLPHAAVLPSLYVIFLSVDLSLPLPPSLPRVRQGSIFKSAKSTTPGENGYKGRWREKTWEGGERTAASNCCETLTHTRGVGERNCSESLKTRRVQLGPSALSLSLCHQC